MNMQVTIVKEKSYSKILLTFIIHKGVQQGDEMACSLFNITLEYAIRKSGIQRKAPYSTNWSILWPMLMT